MTDLERLERDIADIGEVAASLGLDSFPLHFEVCPPQILYTFGAYGGMPTRFSHWSFGKAFHRMKTHYDYDLSRIYELVINSDPAYAFLLEGNSRAQNKLVVAHVFAHADFFKHNRAFERTNRAMLETMAQSAERIRGYEFREGRERVESFLDAALSVQGQVSCGLPPEKPPGGRAEVERPPETPYDDLWSIGEEPPPSPRQERPRRGEEGDLLLFLSRRARDLEDWQRDVLEIVRGEMLYFWPQLSTKIMNEGWATLWHRRILRELDVPEEEAWEFARMTAGILQPSPLRPNPYLLGMRVFEDFEARWEHPGERDREKLGLAGGEGREKLFEVRETETDQSFLRNYLTRELVEELDLYLYRRVGDEWRITEKDWEKVRDGLVDQLTNNGFPLVEVVDDDHGHRGELYLAHRYDGRPLDLRHLERTLGHLFSIWRRPVYLETVLGGQPAVFRAEGEEVRRV